MSSVEEAEDIGSQYTLQLDQEDIKGLGDGRRTVGLVC